MTLFVLDETMKISELDIKYIDGSFAYLELDGRKFSYNLNGAKVQTLYQVLYHDTRYLCSMDYKSLEFVRDFVQNRLRNVIGEYTQLSRKIGEEYFK